MADRLVDADFDARLLFNQKTTALLIGISVQAFQAWGIEADDRKGREAFYYWPKILAERDRRHLPQPPDPEDKELLDLEQERARLAKEQADKTALDNAARRGELLEASIVEKAWSEITVALRARALSLPTKVAAELAAMNDANRIRERLDREIHEILSEVAAYQPSGAVENDPEDRPHRAEADQAAADPDGQSVGGLEPPAKPGKQRRAGKVAH